jgi:ABC-type nitrate/sulfonate/bicarbonate transport system substrate-binding protein
VAAVPLSGAAAAILVRQDSPFRSLAELRGKSLAYANGSSAQNFADAALRNVGLTLADVKSVNLGPADGAAALARGDVDAWIIWDPYYALAELQYGARALVTALNATRSYQFYLGNKDYLAAHAPIAKALLEALKAEGAWAKAYPDEVATIMSQATGLPKPVQLRVARRQDYDLRPIDAQTIADQQSLADRLLSQKVIPKAVRVSDAVWTGWA